MLYQSQTTALRPLTTAHLAQTMALLELTSAELRQKIEAEIASNPALELMDEHRCPICHRSQARPGVCPLCSAPNAESGDNPIIFISPSYDFRKFERRISDGESSSEEWLAAVEDLPTYVMHQIATEISPAQRPLAAHLLTSLDEDGLLRTPLLEFSRYHHVSLGEVQQVLGIIQHADPPGVGSPSPQAALLVQLEMLSETYEIPPLAETAIRNGLDLLCRHAYQELAELMGVSEEEARGTARFISENLNPYPARAHWGDHRNLPETDILFHEPDIIITCLNDSPGAQLVVEIVSPYAGSLRVNPLFREALVDAPEEKVDEWQADLESASLLVKCLQQRNHTLVRLMERMAVIQREFILYGDAHLKPVTRAQLASELNVHESTVSRAVSSKDVLLPNRRIVPLAKMFDPSLHIRTALRQIISTESKPLSDTQLAKMLSKQGYPVARRTVAKYRAMEGILSARFRDLQPPSMTQ